MDANNAKQPAASASTSSSSSSTPARSEPIKKFKLDPMSLLLPHERQMYAAPNPAPPANYGQQQMPQGQMYQQGGGQRAQPGTLGSIVLSMDGLSDDLAVNPFPTHATPPAPTAYPSHASPFNTPQPTSSGWSPHDQSAQSTTMTPRHTEGGRSSRPRLEDWEIVETLGTGTFGRVLLVRQRPSYRQPIIRSSHISPRMSILCRRVSSQQHMPMVNYLISQ
jgi:protein kinase A